uniref:Tail assembly chaperone n=1 Tax=Dulem virus 38 TaxID=3145756 RepID=A0AAU8B0G8_9CAUD
MATITIPGKHRKSVTVDLVGTEYTVRPPKASVAIFLSQALKDADTDPEKMMEGLAKWCHVLFGKETGADVVKRLKSPSDDLDIKDLTSLITAVMEDAGENPTT